MIVNPPGPASTAQGIDKSCPGQSFVGYDGHHYQVHVQAWVANSSNQWESIGSKCSNHYSSLGASEPNIYGQTLQRIPGAASDYCTAY